MYDQCASDSQCTGTMNCMLGWLRGRAIIRFSIDFVSNSKNYSKVYPLDAEEAKRKSIFEQTLRTIVQRNSAPYLHATHGVNEFADLTPAELKAQYLGYVKSNRSRSSSPQRQQPE